MPANEMHGGYTLLGIPAVSAVQQALRAQPSAVAFWFGAQTSRGFRTHHRIIQI